MGAAASSSSSSPPLEAATAAAGGADGATARASVDGGGGGAADAAETVVLDASTAVGEVEEEHEECYFYRFMKGGGCKEEFIAWKKCVEEPEAATGGIDDVVRCQDIGAALLKCMNAHADYYAPRWRVPHDMTAFLEAFQAQEAAVAAASDFTTSGDW